MVNWEYRKNKRTARYPFRWWTAWTVRWTLKRTWIWDPSQINTSRKNVDPKGKIFYLGNPPMDLEWMERHERRSKYIVLALANPGNNSIFREEVHAISIRENHNKGLEGVKFYIMAVRLKALRIFLSLDWSLTLLKTTRWKRRSR